MLTPAIKAQIEAEITQNPVVLYMKGTQNQPMCGFSARAAGILSSLGVSFKDINILQNEDLREGMKEFSDWPTFPQLYVNAEFIGGCDIMTEMAANGELQKLLQTK